MWQQVLMGGLVLLAAGPVWALAERYHEEIAVLMEHTRAHFDWSGIRAPEVATTKPLLQIAPVADRQSVGGTLASSRFVALSGTGAVAKPAALPASAYSRAVPAYGAPSSAPSAFNASGPAFETRGARAASAATVRPKITVGSDTWSGGSSATSADPGWSTPGNWVGGEAPAPGGNADVVFTPTPAGATATNVDVNYTINSLTFQGPIAGVGGVPATDTPSYNVTGSGGVTLTVGAGGITDASANKQTLSVPVALGTAQTWNVSNAAGNLEVDGVVSGTSALTKTGAGTLTLSATNTLSGALTVSAGTVVELNNGAALPSGTVAIASGATVALQSDPGNELTQGPVTFTGAGTLATTGASFVDFGGNGTVTIALSQGGLIDVRAGFVTGSSSFQADYSNNLGSLNIAAGATFNGAEGDIRVDALTGAGTLQGGNFNSGSTTIGVANGSGTFTGVIQDNEFSEESAGILALTKVGTGTQTLTGNNTYSGGTVVAGGKFFVNNVPVNPGDSGTGSGTVFVEPSGAGTWLGGTGTIGGDTVVGDYPAFNPTLRAGAGSRVSAGMATLTPGAAVGGVSTPGILTFNGNLTLTSGTTTTELDIAGTTPGTGYDQVKVGGNLTLAGTLTLTLAPGTKLAVGETFYVFNLTNTAGTVTGTFENANPDGTYTDSAGDVYTINYAATDPADGDAAMNDVSLTVFSVPEPGTWAMLGLGMAGLALGMARRRVTA